MTRSTVEFVRNRTIYVICKKETKYVVLNTVTSDECISTTVEVRHSSDLSSLCEQGMSEGTGTPPLLR